MMEPPSPIDSEPLFTTLEQIRDVHAGLLDADAGDTPPGPEFWLAARAFAVRLAESGIYFGEPHEVKACQGYLSYWGHELSRAKAEKQWSGDAQLPELKPYDEAALQALQCRFANPFENLATELEALPRIGDELAKLIEGKATAAGLRFELDLVREITSQVAGDASAPTLIEFCLYHLFEDPKTRIGNKLRRPPGEGSFSCLQYLVDKAESLHGQQGPAEQQAMLDALSLDPLEPADAVFSEQKIDAVTGALSPTFRDAAGHSLALRPFLVSSRLLFQAESGLSIVHPALFRRWPSLFAEIRVRRERELAEIRQRDERERVRRRRWMYGLLYGLSALALASVVFGVVQFLARQSQEDERTANSLAASSYAEAGEKRLEMALSAVKTSPSPTTKTALNEAIWEMLAANAKNALQEGKRAGEALAAWGSQSSVIPCGSDGREKESVCFVNSKRERVMLPGLVGDDMAFGTDPNETWIAVAWPKLSPYGLTKARKIQLAVYQFVPEGTAQLVGAIRDTQCEGWVENVRVSPRGSAVTIDCLPSSEEGPLWDLVAVSDDASNPLLTALNNLEKSERESIQAIYFVSPDERGEAVLKDVGVLQVTTTDAKEKPDVFRSSILRVMARPSQLALLQDRGFAAIGALNAPLILVHEQTGSALGSDAIYPVPIGLGAAKRVHSSSNGKCIEVRTFSQETDRAFAYHIVLEDKVLKQVAESMTGATPCYDARHLCGFTEASQCPLKARAK